MCTSYSCKCKVFENVKEEWRLKSLPKRFPKVYATAGFYCIDDGTEKLSCPFCHIILGYWLMKEDPFYVHVLFSPKCPLMTGKSDTGNIAVCETTLENHLSRLRQVKTLIRPALTMSEQRESRRKHVLLRILDNPGIELEIQNNFIILHTGDMVSATEWKWNENSKEVIRLRSKIPPVVSRYPNMVCYRERAHSFRQSILSLNQQLSMALIGFFIDRSQNQVMCFSCGIRLPYVTEDSPYLQHHRHAARCNFCPMRPTKVINSAAQVIETNNVISFFGACTKHFVEDDLCTTLILREQTLSTTKTQYRALEPQHIKTGNSNIGLLPDSEADIDDAEKFTTTNDVERAPLELTVIDLCDDPQPPLPELPPPTTPLPPPPPASTPPPPSSTPPPPQTEPLPLLTNRDPRIVKLIRERIINQQQVQTREPQQVQTQEPPQTQQQSQESDVVVASTSRYALEELNRQMQEMAKLDAALAAAATAIAEANSQQIDSDSDDDNDTSDSDEDFEADNFSDISDDDDNTVVISDSEQEDPSYSDHTSNYDWSDTSEEQEGRYPYTNFLFDEISRPEVNEHPVIPGPEVNEHPVTPRPEANERPVTPRPEAAVEAIVAQIPLRNLQIHLTRIDDNNNQQPAVTSTTAPTAPIAPIAPIRDPLEVFPYEGPTTSRAIRSRRLTANYTSDEPSLPIRRRSYNRTRTTPFSRQRRATTDGNDAFRSSSSSSDADVIPILHNEDMTCKICCNNKMDCAIVPCGHMTTCLACVNRVKRCPNCNNNIEKILKVYY